MSRESVFTTRFKKHYDELKWLYIELYQNYDMLGELCEQLEVFYKSRNRSLKLRDRKCENNPDWFKHNDMLGMMLYIDNFAGDIQGVESKIDYIKDCHVNTIHLMPFLDTPADRSDGGYAVSDFRKVRPELGTMDDLAHFTHTCHKNKINVCMDFVMNHTSEDHEWARKARQGDGEYMSRYFFYDNYSIPSRFEKTVPQVFPTTAPGNFTYLPEIGHYVMTTFYPYQWDLNYANPRVFNEMMYNFLYLANQGVDIIRLDAVPYIWKRLGTNCRNLHEVHIIVRLMRIISEIVCPSILLLGEVVMEPDKVVPYFGSVLSPECHMLYNVTTMCTTWNTVATRDVSLLKKQLDTAFSLPTEYTFLNYLRCHDDIGWGLDYDSLKPLGIQETTHKHYLNQYFLGYTYGSESRGELYNDDPVTGDARFCGTTASMCGIEAAAYEGNMQKLDQSINFDIMLHAYMLSLSGIPMLYSGDEIGELNDYSYKENANKRTDSRYIHRGAMKWDDVQKRNTPGTIPQKVFSKLGALETLRQNESIFDSQARVYTYDLHNEHVLGITRVLDGTKFIGIYNFSELPQHIILTESGEWTDMITDQSMARIDDLDIDGHSFKWFIQKNICTDKNERI